MQITISNQSGKHANRYPACNYCKFFSVHMLWLISEEDVGNYRSETRCHLKSHALSMRAAVLPKAMQASINDYHIDKHLDLLHII